MTDGSVGVHGSVGPELPEVGVLLGVDWDEGELNVEPLRVEPLRVEPLRVEPLMVELEGVPPEEDPLDGGELEVVDEEPEVDPAVPDVGVTPGPARGGSTGVTIAGVRLGCNVKDDEDCGKLAQPTITAKIAVSAASRAARRAGERRLLLIETTVRVLA